MYLVNESSKLEPVNRDNKIREKSQSLLDHPRICNEIKKMAFEDNGTDRIHLQ